MAKFSVGDAVQFNERHKWVGCMGFVSRVNDYGDSYVRYMIGVPVPQQGTAYIFSLEENEEFEKIGTSIFMPSESEEEE